MNLMRLENQFLPAALLAGTEIYARVALQGVEQAFLSVVMEWSMRWVAAAREKLFAAGEFDRK